MTSQLASPAAAGRDPRDAALAHAQLAPLIVTQTLRLIDAIQATEGSCVQHVESVVDLLKEDADRPESLIDLSLSFEGDESCVLFALLHFLYNTCRPFSYDDDDVAADKTEAEILLIMKVLPLLPKLLRSFDPATVDPKTGNNTLHEMSRLCSFFMSDKRGWRYELAKLFIAHGVSVHTRNQFGRTPLLDYAATALMVNSADVMRLLLENGADLNTQDEKGNGVLHYLIKAYAVKLLEDFCTGDEVSRLDCFLSNSSRQNPFDLVAERLAKHPDDQRAKRMRQVLKDAQTALWDQHTRPVLQLHLNQVLSVRDLAELALGFIDGSSRPSDRVAMQTDDGHPDAAAAAARS